MRPPWLTRWLPQIVGLAAGLLLARLVMDAMSDIEPAPATPFVLAAGYLTCVLAALAVTISWRRISAGRHVDAAHAGDGRPAHAGELASPPDPNASRPGGSSPDGGGDRPSAGERQR